MRRAPTSYYVCCVDSKTSGAVEETTVPPGLAHRAGLAQEWVSEGSLVSPNNVPPGTAAQWCVLLQLSEECWRWDHTSCLWVVRS